jgi:5-methyltetrahydrofolate--homocysteine methyltransferase
VRPFSRGGRPVLVDGAMGTALLARGLAEGTLPERWVFECPWEVARVHADHVAAGARILLTCSFNLARAKPAELPASGGEVARRAVWLARAARPWAVAGCTGTTGLSRPDGGGPPDSELRERFEEASRALATAGVDLLWTETHLTLREARAALWAGMRTGLPVVASVFLSSGPDGLTAVDGTPGVDLLETLWRDGAVAVGVNCVDPDEALAALVAEAASRVPVPLVVKPHAGLPGAPVQPSRFASGVARAVRAGATLAGGCCGAGPAHLRALSRALLLDGPGPQALG